MKTNVKNERLQCRLSIVILCCLVSNQSNHQESVSDGHHVGAGHLPSVGSVVGPNAAGEFVVVDE